MTMDLQELLDRIACAHAPRPDAAGLRTLHRAWVHAVPFENLDIHLQRTIALDTNAFYEKIVLNRRGGFCYEVNGLFGELLRQLGFRTTTLSARVFDGDGSRGRDFVHLLSLVEIDHEQWVVDVGFGDWSAEPLKLANERLVDNDRYRLEQRGNEWIAMRNRGEGWNDCYSFQLEPRRLKQFEPICQDLQTSENSFFRKRIICTMPTANGRITLADDRFIVTDNGVKREQAIVDEDALKQIFVDRFGLPLADEEIAVLWKRIDKKNA